MRWVVGAVRAAVIGIACYFAVRWASEAVRVFTSPNFGLDEFGRAQDVFSIGRALGMHGYELVRVAAFLGAFKLVGAAAFALHLMDRVRTLVSERPAEHEMLEGALVLVALLILFGAVPAMVQNDIALLRVYGVGLLLAGVAALLSVYERRAIAAMTGGRSATAAPRRVPIPWSRLADVPPVANTIELFDQFVRRWSDDISPAPSSGAPRRD